MKKLIDTLKTNYGFFDGMTNRLFGTSQQYWYEKFDCLKDIKNTITQQSQGEYSTLAFLDDEFYYNLFGDLCISPMLERLLDNDGKISQYAQWDKFYLIMFARFKNKWDRLYALLSAEYNPIENYSMTEDVSEAQATDFTTTQKQSTDLSTTTTTDEKTTQETSEQGFNSTDYVPKEKIETTRDGDDNEITQHVTGLANDNVLETTTTGDPEKNVKTISHTRSGNIGVTTSQQMIESEIQLWQWNFIKDVVYKDVASVLCGNVFVD